MSSEVISLDDCRKAKAIANDKEPRIIARRLRPERDALPEWIASELRQKFEEVYDGLAHWVGIKTEGELYNVDVIQRGRTDFELRAIIARPSPISPILPAA